VAITIDKIVVLSGFSASGKDRLCKYISDNYNYNMIISHTSRPLRPNESEGNPYYFISKNEFEEMKDNNEFIECRKYDTLLRGNPDVWYYGVHKSSIDLSKHNYIVVLDVLGLKEFKEKYKDNIISFFIDVDQMTRKGRCIGRADFDETEWARRWLDDLENFTDEVINKEIDYIVENYNFPECLEFILNKIEGDV